jgi:hypothetical protein
LQSLQTSKVNDAAPLLRHHAWEHSLEQEEGPRQLYLNLALPHLKGHCAKGVGWHRKEHIVDHHIHVT